MTLAQQTQNQISLDVDECDDQFVLDSLTCLNNTTADEDDETWLYSPDSTKTDENGGIEEDLQSWLADAVNKINFTTRSALARRLEQKRKKKAEKEDKEGATAVKLKEKKSPSRSRPNSFLAKIEEDSCEEKERSSNESDKSSGKNLKISSSSKPVATINEMETDDVEDDVFYDAKEHATPTKILAVELNSKLSTNTHYESAKESFSSQSHPPQKLSSGSADFENIKGLSEIERRAMEQEKELIMELQNYMNHNNNTLSRKNSNDLPPNVSTSTSKQHEILSSTSSSGSTTAGNKVVNGIHPSNMQQQKGGSTPYKRQNSLVDDATALAIDLSNVAEVAEELLTQTLTSRLPLPRPQVIPGKTAIPVPAPRRSLRKRRSNPNSNNPYSPISSECGTSCGASSGASSVQLNDDDECF